MLAENLRIQVKAESGSGGCAVEPVKAYTETLQLLLGGVDCAPQSYRKASKPVRSGQESRKEAASRYSGSVGGHDAEATSSSVRELFPPMQRGGQGGIPSIQSASPVELIKVSGYAQWNSGHVFLCPESNGWANAIQSASGHQGGDQILPSGKEAERLASSSYMRDRAGAASKEHKDHRVGFRHHTSRCGQRRKQGGKSASPQAVAAQVARGSATTFSTDKRQPSAQEGVADCGENSRTDSQPATGLLAQGSEGLRQQIRNHSHRRFEPVGNGEESPSGAVNTRRIVGDAAKPDRSQSCKCWADDHRSATEVDISMVFSLRGNRSEGVKRANARLPALRLLGLPRHQCGEEHFKAGTQPSGRGCNSGLAELRSVGFIRRVSRLGERRSKALGGVA